MKLVIKWFILTVAIFATAYLLPGVEVAGFVAAMLAAVVLGIINAVIKPVIKILTLPINILTLGLFSLVISALLILGMDWLLDDFSVDGFWWALLFGIVVAAINAILLKVIGEDK